MGIAVLPREAVFTGCLIFGARCFGKGVIFTTNNHSNQRRENQ